LLFKILSEKRNKPNPHKNAPSAALEMPISSKLAQLKDKLGGLDSPIYLSSDDDAEK
jgi:hypothetical protein